MYQALLLGIISIKKTNKDICHVVMGFSWLACFLTFWKLFLRLKRKHIIKTLLLFALEKSTKLFVI